MLTEAVLNYKFNDKCFMFSHTGNLLFLYIIVIQRFLVAKNLGLLIKIQL